MKVRSLVNRGSLHIGETYDVTEGHGRSLLAQGIVVEVTPTVPAPKVKPQKQALVEPPKVEDDNEPDPLPRRPFGRNKKTDD